ncbi:MAG TPA: ACP phosphodiesterase [Rhodocyclaceae bacterium]|nr:ACP phosphodiesterase [Rhodocyclaceae bacterium]
MNYLAHAYLAGEADSDRLGGLMGDFVKGPLPCGLPADLAAGVALHRRIDSYADTHPAFQRSRTRVSAARRRYAGVMVDMFYDHLLASHWEAYSAQALTQYSHAVYDLLDANASLLPERLGQVRIWMRKDDWLGGYRTLEGTGNALDRIARHRLSRPGTLPGAIEELANDYPGFKADFLEFMSDAIAMTALVRAGR